MANKIKLPPIPEQLVLDRIKFENPWWVTGETEMEYRQFKRREYFASFYSLVEETEIRRAVVLMGPRRAGKTVMLHHSIQQLIEKQINPQKICFINVENPIYNNIGLEHLFSMARKAVSNENPAGWYVFFDEIQYLKNWEIHLKVLVDSYPHTKFIVSGSAAAALKLQSVESGAGRFTDFLLPPLTFKEYIMLKGFEHLMRPSGLAWQGSLKKYYTTFHIVELNRHFFEYLNFGGYPELLFSDKLRQNSGRYIKSDIIDKVLLRDLPSLYGIQDVQELNSFFTMISYYTGNEVSLDSLSQNSGVDKNLLKKYLEYLQAAFLIKIVHRVDDSVKKFRRAAFYKVYLTNPSLRSALFTQLLPEDDMAGSIVETAIYAQSFHRNTIPAYYARWTKGKTHGEVDMVGLDDKKFKPIWAAEIKWSNRYYEFPNELTSLLHFCKMNKLTSALVTTIDKEGIKEAEGITLYFVPAALLAYSLMPEDGTE